VLLCEHRIPAAAISRTAIKMYFIAGFFAGVSGTPGL
jgi:hypothetical protein